MTKRRTDRWYLGGHVPLPNPPAYNPNGVHWFITNLEFTTRRAAMADVRKYRKHYAKYGVTPTFSLHRRIEVSYESFE
jgi:hypothetical protein